MSIHAPRNLMISCLLLLFMSFGMVYGHSGATGIVKQRMDGMKAMGETSKIVSDMYKGKKQFDRAAVVEAVEAFILHGEEMANLFPDTDESRTGSKTEALPLIWERWDDFSDYIEDFNKQTQNLKMTLSVEHTHDELKKAFSKTIKTCSDCHRRFRQSKR
ncbi:MAG: cytochrome c [Gammaproteobacteria bacterium]|nr:cytochrome c [Gammaproteobacteria bacterium]